MLDRKMGSHWLVYGTRHLDDLRGFFARAEFGHGVASVSASMLILLVLVIDRSV